MPEQILALIRPGAIAAWQIRGDTEFAAARLRRMRAPRRRRFAPARAPRLRARGVV
jgi:hypothetical protein